MASSTLNNPAATDELGAVIGRSVQLLGIQSGVVLLRGTLGAGKSSLVRAMLRAMGVTGPIPSPTYTLVEPYIIGDLRVCHLDLYRLSEAGELDALGGRELFDDLLLIEWPERAPQLLERANLIVDIEIAGKGRSVLLRAQGSSPEWRAVVEAGAAVFA